MCSSIRQNNNQEERNGDAIAECIDGDYGCEAMFTKRLKIQDGSLHKVSIKMLRNAFMKCDINNILRIHKTANLSKDT